MHGKALDEHDLVAWPEVQHRDHSLGDDGEHADQQPHSSAADLRTQQERGGAEDPGEQSQWWEEIAGAAHGRSEERRGGKEWGWRGGRDQGEKEGETAE